MTPGQRVGKKAKRLGKALLAIPGTCWSVLQSLFACVRSSHHSSPHLTYGTAFSGPASCMTLERRRAAFKRCYTMVNAGLTVTKCFRSLFSIGLHHRCQR